MPNLQISGPQTSNLNKTSSHLIPSNLTAHSKRLLHLLLLAVASLTMLGASDPSTRFDRLGHQLMCTCSCGEILLECNHVGCPTSGPMITELHNLLGGGGAGGGGTTVAASISNKSVLDWFASKYGPIVLAAPIRGGFDLVAWIMPFAVLAMGIVAVFYFAHLWKQRHAEAVLAQPGLPTYPTANTDSMRERIRRDTHYE